MNEDVTRRIAALESELESLKASVAAEARPSAPTSDRRGMVKLLAAGAVGAIGGAAVLTGSASAVDGVDPVLQGVDNATTNATSLTSAAQSGIVVTGGTSGVGIIADGNLGNAWFPGGGGSPVGTDGLVGILWVDVDGNWWGATADDAADGLWRKLAGPDTAGQLHILPAPIRVYDSRPGQPPEAIQPKLPTSANSPRSIDTTANGSGVPPTANAVLITLTITGPQAPGFATVWPVGPWPGTSNINFAVGQDVATTTVVGCGPGANIQVLSNTVTNFLIDVVGYYQ